LAGRAGIGDEPRLELLNPVAVGIDHRRRDLLLCLLVAEDVGCDAGLGLLAYDLGHLVVVGIA
jgi:hypothetical protein